MKLNLEIIMNRMLKEQNKLFESERQFEYTFAQLIKKEYPNATVLVEACPTFQIKSGNDDKMHGQFTDILVIIGSQLYPIELKHSLKKDDIKEDYTNGGYTNIKESYERDKGRIKCIEDNYSKFGNGYQFDEGYTILLTNCSYFWNRTSKNYINIGTWYNGIKLTDGEYRYNINTI